MRHGWRFPPLGAHTAACSTRSSTSSGMGSVRYLRIDLVVEMTSWNDSLMGAV
jgi:hypothetical protein